MSAQFTPGPWVAHGFTYPEGVAGDVFAKDSNNVLSATPICRVVEPVSKMDADLRRPPLDALQAIARKNDARPIIEANARLIAAAPDFAAVASDAAYYLEHYANFIRTDVKADDFERHPYVPSIEEAAAKLRDALAKAGISS